MFLDDHILFGHLFSFLNQHLISTLISLCLCFYSRVSRLHLFNFSFSRVHSLLLSSTQPGIVDIGSYK